MKCKIFCFLILIMGSLHVKGSDPFRLYTTRDGLNSNYIYQAVTDTFGYLWIGTDRGISRFNGESFLNFSKSDDFPFSEVYNMFPDTKGKVWISSKYYSYFAYEDKIYQAKDEEGKPLQIACNRIFTDEEFLILYDEKDIYYLKETKFGHYKTLKIIRNTGKLIYIRKNQKAIYHSRTNIHVHCVLWKEQNIKHSYKTKIYRTFIPFFYSTKDQPFLEDFFLLHSANSLKFYNIKEDKFSDITFQVKRKPFYKFFYSNNKLFLNNGDELFVLKKNKFNAVSYALPLNAVNSIWVDKQNHWICTSNGLYKVNKASAFKSYGKKEINIDNLTYHPKKEKVYFTTTSGTIFKADPKFLDSIRSITTVKGGVYSLSNAPDKIYVCPLNREIIVESNNDLIGAKNSHVMWQDSILLKNTAFTDINSRLDFEFNRPLSVIKYNSNQYFAINKKELALFSGRKRETLLDFEKESFYDPISFHLINTDLYIVSGTKGILKFDIKTKKILSKISYAKVCEDLKINTSFSFGNKIYLGSNKGLLIYCIIEDKINRALVFPNNDEANYINEIEFFENTLILATASGLKTYYLNHESPLNQKSTLANFKALKYQNEPKSKLYQLVFNSEDDVKLVYDAVNFDINDQKFLIVHNSDSIRTEQRNFQFSNLQSGKHQFTVYALPYGIGTLKSKPLKAEVIIDKPLAYQTWFLLVFFAVSLLLIGLILLSFFNRYKKRLNLISERDHLELTSIKAQMNPHFTFNALNSIQNLIYNRDKKIATKAVANFAALLRSILEHSDETFIPLSKEISIWKRFLEVEKMRFEKPFNYEIKIQEGLDPDDLLIPAMCVQPLLENAIWHGLLPLNQREPELIVEIKKKENYLEIIVDDNGVGFASASVSRHASKGSDLIRRRLELITKINKIYTDISYLHKKDATERPLGTKVIIRIGATTSGNN